MRHKIIIYKCDICNELIAKNSEDKNITCPYCENKFKNNDGNQIKEVECDY